MFQFYQKQSWNSCPGFLQLPDSSPKPFSWPIFLQSESVLQLLWARDLNCLESHHWHFFFTLRYICHNNTNNENNIRDCLQSNNKANNKKDYPQCDSNCRHDFDEPMDFFSQWSVFLKVFGKNKNLIFTLDVFEARFAMFPITVSSPVRMTTPTPSPSRFRVVKNAKFLVSK